MLLLAVAAMIMPGVFALVQGDGLPHPGDAIVNYGSTLEHLSLAVAIVLIISYGAGLLFSLRTHASLFNPHEDESSTEGRGSWSTRRSVLALAIAGVLVGVLSEILVGSIEETSHAIGLSEFFIGAIVVAIVGNAAEHWVAVLVAAKDKMDLAVGIAIGSSAQIALFVAPVLVLVSFVLGPNPMPLVFNGFELGAIVLAVIIANQVTNEGESTWYEGLQLLAVYLVLALAFFFAQIADEKNKDQCIVVFDDPFNSQDRARRTYTINQIIRCGDEVGQVIVLSHDNRFLRLIDGLLQAGYLEEWRYFATLSGSPQGGIVSPILANIWPATSSRASRPCSPPR